MNRIDLPVLDDAQTRAGTRRPEWRHRLVQAERGFVMGFRADSTIFGHLFAWLIVAVTGMVLNLHWQQWIVVGLCLSFALTAELFHQAFRTLLTGDDRQASPREMRALGLATAGVVTASLGAGTTIVTIFFQRLQHLL